MGQRRDEGHEKGIKTGEIKILMDVDAMLWIRASYSRLVQT